jgi:hypothetical protein
VAGSDGLDCDFQQKMWKSWSDRAANADFQETAQVSLGSYPSLAESPVQMVWMLLASHKSITNGQSIAVECIRDVSDDKLKVKIEYNVRSDWPQKIEMFAPGTVFAEGKEYPIPHPYENGYRLWDMNVIATSETNGLAFPQNTIFSRFVMFTSDSTNVELRKFTQTEIQVTNVAESLSHSNDYLPILSHKNLFATDFRFSPTLPRLDGEAVDVIQYQLPDGKWLDRSDNHVKYLRKSLKMETHQTTDKISNVQRAFLFGLFALPAIIFCGFLWKRKLG